MSRRILVLPGIGDSGPQHWQSLWQQQDARMQRVAQRDWEAPQCAEWVATLEQAVAAAGEQTVLVAHSLGCLLVAHWAVQTSRRIAGALLVAPPDPLGAEFPDVARGFAPLPLRALGFRSTVVASSDDPYGSPAFARGCAEAWGSRHVGIGACGHINAASGLGDWVVGRELLEELLG